MKCHFFDNGYCKYKRQCTNKHPSKLCTNQSCLNQGCDRRHPKTCRNFFLRRFCRFGRDCMYSHEINCEACDNLKFVIEKGISEKRELDNNLKDLENKVKKYESKIKELNKQNDDLKRKSQASDTENQKLSEEKESLEKENDDLKTNVCLEMKYACMLCKFKCKKKSDLQNHKEDEHQNKCNICEFKTLK